MRILVVEDEPRLAAALDRGLSAEGFAVDVTGNGLEAVFMGREHTYDCILLDIMLPGLNGYKVCEELRKQKVWTPILMLTAKDGEWDEVEALDTGADDYVTKPFSFDVLLARIRTLTRRQLVERPVAMSVGDLVLDPGTKEVTRAGEVVVLTTREFSLLEYLMRSKGQVVTKSQILSNVWDYDFDGDPNLVEVYIARLRRKLDKPFDRHDIQTLRGTGYRLASS